MLHPPSDLETVYLDQDHKQIKARTREFYVREAFIDFFVNDPKFVTGTILNRNGISPASAGEAAKV
jgi:hypothetical protein